MLEYTVLSLFIVFFLCFLCVLCRKWSCCLFSALSIIFLSFFPPVVNHPATDLAPLISLSAHFLTLLWIGLVFIATHPSSVTAVPFSISFSTSWKSNIELLGRAISWSLCKSLVLIATLFFSFVVLLLLLYRILLLFSFPRDQSSCVDRSLRLMLPKYSPFLLFLMMFSCYLGVSTNVSRFVHWIFVAI